MAPELQQSNLLETTLRSKDALPFRQRDWPNPRGPEFPVELRTFTASYKWQLIGKDRLPNRQSDWPNPRGPEFSVVLRTWTENYKLGLIGKDALPARQRDWQNPNALQSGQRTDQQGVNIALTGVVIVQPPFAMADWPNQSNHASSVQWEGTQNLLPLTATVPAPEAPIVTSGGSGRRYPYGNLDLETWRRGKRRLKTRIEAVQKQIEQKRRGISLAETEEKIHRLTVQLVALQKKLLELLAAMDELRKAQDEEENDVMTAYMAYRMLH